MPSDFSSLRLPNSAHEVIRRHGRSFYLASWFLPRTVRSRVVQLYGWCRWCDDSVDRAPNLEIAGKRLLALRQDLLRMEETAEPNLQCTNWLKNAFHPLEPPNSLCGDLLDGMEMDVMQSPIQSESDLLLYSYRAAGSVGRMMARLLGATDPGADSYAKSLGIAMQLTNIARDVGEDWRLGRCYIPLSWRREQTVNVPYLPKREHIQRILRLAEQHYRRGEEGLQYLPVGSRLAIRTAARLYREIGSEIAKNRYDSVTQRAFVPLRRKCSIVIQCLCSEAGELARTTFRGLRSRLTFPLIKIGDSQMKMEARYIAALGMSLTLIMATALFLLVGINPKDSSYQTMPWLYAGLSAIGALCFWLLARYFESQLSAEQVVPVPIENKSS